jgi:hypothetical protein
MDHPQKPQELVTAVALRALPDHRAGGTSSAANREVVPWRL